MPSRVLITGGAGFIGSHSVARFLEAGWDVRVLDSLASGRRCNLPPDLDFVEGDVRDAAVVAQVMRGCDAVLHLAAQVSVQRSLADPVASADTNVRGFLTVLEAVRRLGVPRLVYASSAAVFGAAATLPVSEATATRPLSPYGLEKLVNEQYAALYGDLHGVSSVGMRYFNVYGPMQDPDSPYAGVISKFAAALGTGRPLTVFGDGGQTRDFVYVADVADANLRALTSRVDGVLNLGTGASVSLLELVAELGRAFGKTPDVRHAPAVVGDIVHSATEVRRARDTLGWQAGTSLAAGLAELAASLRKEAP